MPGPELYCTPSTAQKQNRVDTIGGFQFVDNDTVSLVEYRLISDLEDWTS